jgi:hypothetical protein
MPKFILLMVGATEDPVTQSMEDENGSRPGGAKFDRMPSKILCLQTVDEGNPEKVSDGKHESEPVRGNIHCAEEIWLEVERIGNIPELEEKDETHRVGDKGTTTNGLLAGHADVDEYPEDHTRSKLVEALDVEPANGGIEFTTNEPL